MHRSRYVIALVSATGLAAAALLAPPAASAAGSDTVLAGGFVAPWKFAFGPGSSIYVADAFAGQVVKVDLATGARTTVARGAVTSVDVLGNGTVAVTTSEASEENQGPTGLIRVSPGKVRHVTDLLAFESANDPDGGGPFAGPGDAASNPFGVLQALGSTFVADAAGNDIVKVHAGRTSLLTALPTYTDGDCASRPNNNHGGELSCDPTPTDVELGPDGNLYVSGLGGLYEGHVYKIDPSSGAVLATFGSHDHPLPPLTGLAVGPDGTIYAASGIAGLLLRMTPSGQVTGMQQIDAMDVEWGHGMLAAAVWKLFTPPGSIQKVHLGAF